jgi:hypothetical protein
MAEIVFVVEPESASGRWCIRRGDSVRASYTSRAQAVTDARQLALFECELRGNSAIVRVLDAERHIAEDVICDPRPRRASLATTFRPGGARLLLR